MRGGGGHGVLELGEPVAYQGEQDVVAAGEVPVGEVRGVLDLVGEPAHGHRVPPVAAGHITGRGQDRLPRLGPFPFPASLCRRRLRPVLFVACHWPASLPVSCAKNACSSSWSQCSTAIPSTTRQMSIECITTGRPVGSSPMNGPRKVAR